MNYVVAAFTGSILLIIGIIFKLFPPKKINLWYGYRTNFSVKNQDTWEEAQRFSANLFLQLGILAEALAIVTYVLLGVESILISAIALSVFALLNIVITEIHLRKVFHPDGSRR